MSGALALTGGWVGLASLAIFVVAYGAVMAGNVEGAEEAVRHNFFEFAELFLFLLAAMTYVNTMEERGVFNTLLAWLVGRGLSLRALFWVNGALAFCISPVADNLTTALVMGAVSLAVGRGRPRFVLLACINVVVAANAGGAFSPFGDITTLMVWQAGHVEFFEFFALFVPWAINWLVPAAIMSLSVERGQPRAIDEPPVLEAGSITVVLLFLGTISLTVALHTLLHLPPALGMMAGLGVLKMYRDGGCGRVAALGSERGRGSAGLRGEYWGASGAQPCSVLRRPFIVSSSSAS